MAQQTLLQGLTNIGVPSPRSYVANIRDSGQLGLGMNVPMLDGASALAFPPAIIVVLHTPSMYQEYDRLYAPSGRPGMRETIKNLFECFAKSVTGIDFGYTVETESNPAGPSGQQIEDPTNTKRSDVSPVFTFQELTGNPVWNIHKRWMSDIQHPDSHISMAGSRDMIAIQREGRKPRTRATYSVAFAVIQPDTTHDPDQITGCSIVVNVFPKDIGTFGYERTIGNTQLRERSITYSGLVIDNEYTHELGISLMRNIQMAKVDFMRRAIGYTDVETAIKNSGLQKEVSEALQSQVSGVLQ